MEDREALRIVNLEPFRWSDADARVVRETFSTQRPAVSAVVAKRLLRYWSLRCPREPLFESDEDNLALLLHARALGGSTDDESEIVIALACRDRYKQYLEPLFPPALKWGPRTALSTEIKTALDSKTLHAFVFMEGAAPRQILIVGSGVPHLSELVFSEAYSTSLRVWAGADDIMNCDVLRVELPGSQISPLDLPFNILGESRVLVPAEQAETATAALQSFYAYLSKLEQDTGLIRVHRRLASSLENITSVLRTSARSVGPSGPLIWAPAANDGGGTLPGSACVVPIWRVGKGTKGPLWLNLSPDLLLSPEYQTLFQSYRYKTAEKILADVGTRRDQYENRALGLEARKRQYDEASPEQRKAWWGPTTTLNERFDFELGISIKLAFPEEVLTDTHYAENVPLLIENYRTWARRMRLIEESILVSTQRPDAPVRRFAISTYLDAAGRGRNDGQQMLAGPAFAAWRERVEPMLRFEWRCLLKRERIDPGDVFTRHTFFHTWQRVNDEGQITHLLMTPFSLIDSNSSVVLFEEATKVMVVQDPTDYATEALPPTKEAETEWKEIEEAGKSDGSARESDFTSRFRKYLGDHPTVAFQKTFSALVGDQAPEGANESLGRTLASARNSAKLTIGLEGAVTAWVVDAVQTARERLRTLEGSTGERGARIHLLRAIIETDAEQLD